MLLRNFSLITLLFTIACDDPSEATRAADLTDRVRDEAALDVLPELAAQELWDDGLEEYLDRDCDAGECAWGWNPALDGLDEDLPSIPTTSASDDDRGPASLTSALEPAATGTKSVKVTYVHCFETQDVGEDEPYLLMNGVKVWSKTGVKNGVSYNVGKSALPQVLIELWEQDVSNNDKIGSFTVSPTKANGNYSTLLTGAGGYYRVYYTVSTS